MYSGMDSKGDKSDISLVPSFVSGNLSTKFSIIGVVGTLGHVGLWLVALLLDILMISAATPADQGHIYDLKATSLGFFGTGLGVVLFFTLLHLVGVYRIMPGGGPPILLAAIQGSVMVSLAMDFLAITAIGNSADEYWPKVTGALSQAQVDEYDSSRILVIWGFITKLVLDKVLLMNIEFRPVD